MCTCHSIAALAAKSSYFPVKDNIRTASREVFIFYTNHDLENPVAIWGLIEVGVRDCSHVIFKRILIPIENKRSLTGTTSRKTGRTGVGEGVRVTRVYHDFETTARTFVRFIFIASFFLILHIDHRCTHTHYKLTEGLRSDVVGCFCQFRSSGSRISRFYVPQDHSKPAQPLLSRLSTEPLFLL